MLGLLPNRWASDSRFRYAASGMLPRMVFVRLEILRNPGGGSQKESLKDQCVAAGAVEVSPGQKMRAKVVMPDQ